MTVAELKAELDRIIGRLKADPSVRLVLLFGDIEKDISSVELSHRAMEWR